MGSKRLFRPGFNNIVTGWAFFCSVIALVVGKYTSRLKTLQSISDNLNNLFTRQIIVHHTKSYELMHETILDNLFNIKLCLQAYDRHKYILNKLSLVGLQLPDKYKENNSRRRAFAQNVEILLIIPR